VNDIRHGRVLWMEEVTAETQQNINAFFTENAGRLQQAFTAVEARQPEPESFWERAPTKQDEALAALYLKLQSACMRGSKYNKRENIWEVRRGVRTWEEVAFVCDHVMEAMRMPATDAACKVELRAVLRSAQEKFGNIDKAISIRLVEFDWGHLTLQPETYNATINEDKTVQQAVGEVYPNVLNGVIKQIDIIREGSRRFLWLLQNGDTWLTEDLYDRLEDGDELQIVFEYQLPSGTDVIAGWNNWPVHGPDDDNGWNIPSPTPPAGGPSARHEGAKMVCEWLRELAKVSE